MKLKENIYSSIEKMDTNQLALLYEQIITFENLKNAPIEKMEKVISIEEIHKMTKLSQNSWAETVTNEREERR